MLETPLEKKSSRDGEEPDDAADPPKEWLREVDPQEPIYWVFCGECRQIKVWGRDMTRNRDNLEQRLAKALERKCHPCGTEQHLRGIIHSRLEASVRMRQMELKLLSDPLAPEMVHADSRDH